MVKGRIVALVIIGIMLLTMLMPGAALAAAPATPVNISPASGETDIGLTHEFVGSAFSDADIGNTHYASQWQITTTTGVYTSPVFDSGVDTSNLTTNTIPAGYLLDGTIYYWHVRYQDSTGDWSAYSTEASFTTISSGAPHQPVNISPGNADTDIGLTPILTSSGFSAANMTGTHAASQWQVRTATGSYTSPVFDSGVDITNLTTKTMLAGYLLDGTIYYWHVRHLDSYGNWSAYSTETSFTTIASGAPDRPVNISPINVATNISLTPILKSSAFSAQNVTATHAASWWQITTITGVYTSPVFDSGIDATNLTTNTIPELSAGTTYYWHVRYQDSYGRWSAYSTETSFTTVAAGAPNQPSNISPFNVATNISLTPTLESSAFSDPDAGDAHAASQWQISTTTGVYTSPVFDSGIDDSSLTTNTIPELSASTTYYWHVRYQDSYGRWSAYSTETSFTTGTTTVVVGVEQPVNVSPFGGATDISPDQKLKASVFQGAAGRTHSASRWQVVGSGANQIDPVTGGYKESLYDSGIDPNNKEEIALPVGLVGYGRTYYWHVKYQDDTGAWSAWSAETSFTLVGNSAPSSPRNIEPLDVTGASPVSLTPVLKASDFADPDTSAYIALTDSHAASQWQVTATAGNYSDSVCAWDSGVASPTTSAVVPAGKLAAGTKYYWHVRYRDSQNSWSGYSSETSFTTKALTIPVASFSADKTSVTAGTELVTFTDISTPAGEITAWSWSFGDGTTENWTTLTRPSNGQITHKYTVGGTQTVKLTVYNGAAPEGKELTADIVVHAKPEASITVLTAPAKVGEEVTFKDNSSPTEDITSWEWQFDDGTTVSWTAAQREAAGGQIKHAFKTAGKHTVSLIVKGELGESYYNKQTNVTGPGGFQFGLWMIGVAVAAVVVVAGVMYLVRARKGK
jgi:PKD repeat protein